MDRVINVQVTGCAVRKDSKNAGVQGEANATTLRIVFSPEWTDLAKKIIWLDAGGENPVAKILTTETDGAFETTIPGEPLTKAGQCCFTIQGAKDNVVAMAVTEHLTVLPNDSYGMEPGNAADPTPSVTDQINGKVSALAETVAALGKEMVNPIDKTADMSSPVGRDEDGKLWTDPSVTADAIEKALGYTPADKKTIPTTLPSPHALTFTGAVTGSYDGSQDVSVEIPQGPRGEKGDKGDKGDTGEQGPKGEKGEPGEDGVLIDDGAVTTTDVWSSKHILDMLCPPLQEAGNPVTCYPVTGYPLGVTVSWEPGQAGSGDPSPSNVRAITGRESVRVERCGENLANIGDVSDTVAEDNYFCEYPLLTGILPNVNYTISYIAKSTIGGYNGSIGIGNNYFAKDIVKSNVITSTEEIGIEMTFSVTEQQIKEYGSTLYLRAVRYTEKKTFTYSFRAISVVIGTAAPQSYAPYTGQRAALSLPRPIYGGEVNAATGAGAETWGVDEMTGDKWSEDSSGTQFVCAAKYVAGANYAVVCSIFKSGKCSHTGGYYRINKGDAGFSSIESLREALGSKTIQVAYKLAAPVSITAAGGQSIAALRGVNTLLTDADTLTVTGRADPIKRITDLEDAVASLTTQEV